MRETSPGQQFGRYRLLALLGRGGMGEVYLAAGPGVAGVEKRLAIKRLLPALAEDPGFVARFLDEARLVVQLAHGNIVPVFEAGQVEREHFLAMEYVDGRNLREVLTALATRGETMPVPLAVLVAHEVSRGLDYAHRKTDDAGAPLGIIHRDVSPQNVLLGFDGEVRLVDFGIAKAAGRSQKTHTGGLLGKFGYMSPEQAQGLPLDGRSDLFALGAVLHELLTGIALFDGETDPEVLRKVQEASVSPPSKARPEVPPELDALVLKLLARDPGARFASAGEVERALGKLRYAQGTGPAELSALLGKLFAERPRPQLLDASTAPRPVTATLDAPPAPKSNARWAAPLLALAIPLAAAAGYLAPRAKPAAVVVAPPPVRIEPPAPKPEPAPTPTPTAVLQPAPAPQPEPVKPAPEPVKPAHAKAPKPKPEAAPAPTHTPSETGTLSLRITPWGDIEIDGQSAGETGALVHHPLSAGTHEVRVKNPALGHETSFTVQIVPGMDVLKKVDLTH